MIKTEIPKITNDKGLKTMTIKFKEFNCIGANPPHDHPHIYLNFGRKKEIICPYCGTVYKSVSYTHLTLPTIYSV